MSLMCANKERGKDAWTPQASDNGRKTNLINANGDMNTITERSMQKKETLIGRMWSLSLRIQMGSDKAPPNTKADHCPAGRGAAV